MRKLFSKLTPKASNSKKDRTDAVLANDTAVNSGSSASQNDASEQDLPRLHQAAWSGNLSKIKQYAKDNPNSVDERGRTPLHLACSKGHLQVVKALLQRNATTNIQDLEGKTPLIKAVQALHDPCIECLLQYGCNTNLADDQGFTALHYAATAGANAIAQALLEKGNNVNQQNKDGRTALHLACEKKQAATCQILLERGADGSISDQQLKTPFMIASEVGALDVVALLKNCGADIVNKSQGVATPNSAGTLQSAQARRTAALFSASHSSSHSENDSSPELSRRASRQSSSVIQSSPGIASKHSQAKGPSTGKESLPIIGAGSRRESIASSKQTNSADDEQNSWCSSDDGTKKVLKEKQPKKLNLVKMLETYGTDGKVSNTGNTLAVGGLESTGWSSGDTVSAHERTVLQVPQSRSTENSSGQRGAPTVTAAIHNEDGSWDSDTMSAGPSPRPKMKPGSAQSPAKNSWDSNPSMSKNVTVKKSTDPSSTEPVHIAQHPSAPPITSTDGEDNDNWDSDATSNQDSLRRPQQSAKDGTDPNLRESDSDWDSGEEMTSRTPRNLKNNGPASALQSIVASTSTTQKQDVHAIDTPGIAASVLSDDGKSKVEMTATTRAADRHLQESPKSQSLKLHSTDPLVHGTSLSDCKCIELAAELRGSKKLLQDALAEKQLLANQFDVVQIEKQELIASLNEAKRQKEALENSFRELKSEHDASRGRLTEEEAKRLILQSKVEQLQGELLAKTEQHTRDLVEERRLTRQRLEDCNFDMDRMRKEMSKLEKEKQSGPASVMLDLEQSNRRLVDENSRLSSQIVEANSIIGDLRSAVSRFEARSVEEKLKFEALNKDLNLVKSEREQLLLESQARDQQQSTKISDLLEQTSNSAASKELALANTRQTYEDKIRTLEAETQRSVVRLQEEQRTRTLLENKIDDVQKQLKNAMSEAQLAIESQKDTERTRLQEVQLLQQMLDSKERDLKELTDKCEGLRSIQSNAIRDLRETQEKVLSQATVLTERMSVIVTLRASLQEQTQRIENTERQTASDKKKLAVMQAQMELLQDELQRLRQRKLISAGQDAIGGRLFKTRGMEPQTHLQPRSPTPTHLKELLANAEEEIATKNRQMEELSIQLANASSTKDELTRQAHELEARLHSTEALLASERSGNEALRAHLTACMEHGHRMQSFLRSSQIVTSKLVVGEKESKLGDEMLSNSYSTDLASDEPAVTKVAATLERKLRHESKRCADLAHHNNEMKAKLKLVKLYLKEMAVHQNLLQDDRFSAPAAPPRTTETVAR